MNGKGVIVAINIYDFSKTPNFTHLFTLVVCRSPSKLYFFC